MNLLKKKSRVFRIICCLLAFLLAQNSLEHVQAQGTPFLPPGHNYFVDLSIPYSLPVLRGMRVYPDKPFEFDFMVGSGNRHTIDQKETSLLIKYFLTCLTIPEEDLWVNLSPYESGRIIPDELALTDAGNNLLEQDKFLKQLASSLTYPESRLGKKFWEQVYKKAYERFGTTDLPVNTYNKVWIVPDKAIVYDMGNSALIGETHLKVMLEEDYLAIKNNQRQPGDMALAVSPSTLPNELGLNTKAPQGNNPNALLARTIAAEITKEIILPELEKEINEGKNFAPVRQIFHSMILAAWFKRALKRNVLSDVYINKKKISGIDDVDKNAKEAIYKQYLRIYKVGAYNYIREDVDPISQQVVPRKYFSGGLFFGDLDRAMKTLQVPDPEALRPLLERAQFADVNDAVARVDLVPVGGQADLERLLNNPAMVSDAAQLSKSSKSILSKFLLTVALFTPIVAGGIAHAATITPNADGTLHVQVDNRQDTFSGILRQAQYKGPLWGPKGAVAQVGEVVKGQISDVNRIHLGHSYDIPKPSLQGVQQPIGQVQAPAASPIPPAFTPAPQPNQQFTQRPATAISVPLHYGKKFYLYTGKLPAISIPDVLTAGIGGYIENLDENKTEYEKDEPILIVKNFELESRIAATKATLDDAKGLLARLETANETQAATSNELEDARKEVQRLENQLAQDTAKEALGVVKAPNKLTIRDFQFHLAQQVREGSSLFSYFDGDRIRLDIYLPISAHSNDFDLTLDGKPVKSITSIDWLPTPSTSTAHLSLIVTPTDPIPQGKGVAVSLKIYSPDKTFNKLLNTIVANGGTSVEVGKIETYRIIATADGTIKFLAREGDKVKAGQIVAQIDATPTPYRDQLQQAIGQIAIIHQQITDVQSASGTIGITEINRLRAEEFKWKAQADRLQDLIPRLDIRAPKDGVIVSSAEQRLGGTVKSGEEIFGYSTGAVFLGDINNPQNGILFPAGRIIKHGDFVLVTTKEGVRLIGVTTNFSKAFSPDIQLANQSVEVKVWDPQHALRTGMFVSISLLDKKNQDIAQRVWTQENSTPSASAPPPPPPNDQIDQMANMLNLGQNPQNVPINIQEPATSFPAQGPSLNLSEIEKRVRNYNLTAVTQRITYLQKQLAEKYPNAKSLSLDFNVYTSGGKTYYSGGILGQLPNLAVNLAGGNAYGAAAPIVFSYFAKIAALVTHEKAKQTEFAKIQTEMALLQYQAAVYEQANQAKKAGINLGAQQQNTALLEQFISDLEKAKKVIADRMNAGVGTEEQLRAFDDTIAEARAAESTARKNSGKYTVALNTLTGQKDLHGQVAIALPWNAEFPTISPEQENDWINKLVDANPQIQQAKAEIAAVKQKIKLQKIKGWDANADGVYTTGAINDSITEPAFGGGEEYRVSLMNPGENAANGITIPLFNGPKKIDDRIIAQELQKKQAELDLKISTLKGELAASVSALRDLSKQIKEAGADYQNALKWWELKARFLGVLYSPQDLVKQREAMNKWAMQKIDLERQYFQEEDNLKKLGVLQSDESLVKDKAMNSDQAQLSRRELIFELVSAVTLATMPLGAQQRPGDSTGEFNAWSSRSRLPGPNSTANNPFDSNPFHREAAVDNLLAQYHGTAKDIDRLGQDTMKLSSDERQEVFNFMVERHDLRFLIRLINIARGENAEVVSSAYQSIGDIFTAYPGILEDKFDANGKQTQRGLTRSNFAGSAGYSDQTEQADEVLLNFIAQDPEGTAQASLIFSRFWRADELCHIYNGLDSNSELAKFIKDVMVGRTFLGIINSHLTSGEIQNAGRFSFFLHDDLYARGQINVLPKEYVSFFASPGWRDNMGILRSDVLTGAQQIVEGQISTDRDHPFGGAAGHPQLYPIANPGDSLALLRSMGPELQKDYIDNLVAKKNIPELARIYKNWTILHNPDLFTVVGDALQESLEGRLWKFQIYLRSPDKRLRNVIEAEVTQNIDIVKQDATAIKNPGAMRIFRTAVKKIHDNNSGLSWLMETFRDTFSFIEAASSQDPEAQKAKVEVATREALVIMRDLYLPIFEKDSFIVGEPAYTGTKTDLLNRIAERLNSLNTPEELEQYLNEQAAFSPENQKIIDELRKYRDDILNGNHQGITKGGAMKGIEWLYHTNLLSGLLITSGAAYVLLPIFWDWKVRKFSSLEKLMDISDAKSLNDKSRNGEGIDRKRLEPRAADLLMAWENDLRNFSKNGAYSPEEMLKYQKDINHHADEVIGALPYIPDLMDSEAVAAENRAYQDSYASFMKLAHRTISAWADRLKSENLTQLQRQQYWDNTFMMLLKMVYVEKYLDILQGRVNVNTSINEHFHKEHWLEKINKLTTWIFGIDFIANKPMRKLEPDLRDLMETGNLVIPGLYKDIDGVVKDSLNRLKIVIFEGRRFGSYGYAETSDNLRILKLLGRLVFLIPTAYFVIKSILGLFGVMPFNLLDVFSSIGTLCLALAIQWGPILANNRAAYNKRMKEIMIRLYNKTNESLGLGQKVGNWKSFKRMIKAQAAADAAVISSPTKSPGGIDLNFQPQFIDRFSRTGSLPASETAFANMPDGFKGFNFNIVRFTSELTINGAFQLMFNSK